MATFQSYYQASIYKLTLINDINTLKTKKMQYDSLIRDLEYILGELGSAVGNLSNASRNYKNAYQTSGGDRVNRKDFDNLNNDITALRNRIAGTLIPRARADSSNIVSSIRVDENALNNIYYYSNYNKERVWKLYKLY